MRDARIDVSDNKKLSEKAYCTSLNKRTDCVHGMNSHLTFAGKAKLGSYSYMPPNYRGIFSCIVLKLCY